MQGRLSPMVDGKVQAFPALLWREEFDLAKKIGFELIEWVLDLTHVYKNPIFSITGRDEILKLQKDYGIEISSICCDCFMDYPLGSDNKKIRFESQGLLLELIRVCADIGIRYIELPLIGNAEIKHEEKAEILINLLNDLVPLLDQKKVYLLLETNLNPKENSEILKRMPSDYILINYDTGNSIYWGFNPEDEIPVYGSRIGNIHIKDCTVKDYTVPLGQGDVDFNLTFKLLRECGYKGDFILQTARGKDDFKDARKYFEFTHHYIQKYLL
jgi:L-ribulose-5-phosphate 3-epimerase